MLLYWCVVIIFKILFFAYFFNQDRFSGMKCWISSILHLLWATRSEADRARSRGYQSAVTTGAPQQQYILLSIDFKHIVRGTNQFCFHMLKVYLWWTGPAARHGPTMTLFDGLYLNHSKTCEPVVLTKTQLLALNLLYFLFWNRYLSLFQTYSIIREGGLLPFFLTFLHIARDLLNIF